MSLCPTYSSQATELIQRDMTMIVAEHNVEIHNTSLIFYGYVQLVTWALRGHYVKIKSHALIALSILLFTLHSDISWGRVNNSL